MKPQFECAVAAGFLRSGGILLNASHCAALMAAAGALLAHALTARMLFAASILCWPAAGYFGLRVSIDARLFRELGRAPEEGGAALDELRRAWGMGGGKAGRSIGERSGGALRLWKRLAAAVGTQVALTAAAILIQAWIQGRSQ